MSKAAKLTRDLGGNMAASINGSAEPTAYAHTSDAMFIDRRRDMTASLIGIDRIVPDPGQPRKSFDAEELKRLGQSLLHHGQLQACLVRWDGRAGKYVLIAGERRHRAALEAGLHELRCIVWDTDHEIDPSGVREMQIVENALRSDLPPLEEAAAFRELMSLKNWKARELAEKLHLHPSKVTRALSLLKLPDAVREAIRHGDIAPAVAYEVSKAPPEQQTALAAEAVEKKLTRDEVAEKVKSKPASKSPPVQEDATYSSTAPWTFTTPKGETLRIVPRPGAQVFGLISVATILRKALEGVEACISKQVAGETKAVCDACREEEDTIEHVMLRTGKDVPAVYKTPAKLCQSCRIMKSGKYRKAL